MPSTANLVLPYPSGTEAAQGATQIQALAQAVDLHGHGVIICTAATRPTAAPYRVEGRRIYETDTDRELLWNGSAWVTRSPVSATVAASQSTTSTTFVDLATAGPAVTLYTGTAALVTVSFSGSNSSADNFLLASPAVSGATTLAAADDNATALNGRTSTGGTSRTFRLTGLNAGENTFTLKYRVGAGTGTFLRRDITVIGLP